MGLNKPVEFSTAKLLKEKGFDNECEYFYSKYGAFTYLKPHREYEHLHSYSERLVMYYDGKYDWNSLDVDEGMIALKTAFSESDGYVNCECSAPTITEVIMWLYEKHGIWIVAFPTEQDWTFDIFKGLDCVKSESFFNSPTESHEAAIEYALNNLI